MNRTTAEDVEQLVAVFLHPQAAIQFVGKLRRHIEAGVESEEVGRVQQVDVQGVALDPLAAIEQAAQAADFRRHGDAERGLQRVNAAHLIRDRTDAADPGRDVGHVLQGASAEQRLEQPRRLVNLESNVFHVLAAHLDVQSAFAFDAGQGFDLDGPLRHFVPSTSASIRSLSTRNSGA
jgi:hypothetical protein